MDSISGVGTLDKAMAVLAVAAEGPLTFGEVVARTGLPRSTVHRLVSAWEAHGMLRRDGGGRIALGWRLLVLGRRATASEPLAAAAAGPLSRLAADTGESAQLYVRDGDRRVCVAAAESPHGLRTIVPVGASLPMDRGSAGRALEGSTTPGGWAASVGEREEGVASVSAPVRDPSGAVVAAVSVSGPVGRTGRDPGSRYGPRVVAAAAEVAAAMGWST